MSVQDLVRTGLGFLDRNSPYILTAFGAAGVLGTAVMTGRATVKAYDIVEAERGRRLMDAKKEDPDATYEDIKYIPPKDLVKLCWKPYISPMLMGVASIACIIGANTVHGKRQAALAAAYSLADTTLKNYQKKVVETIGEKKEELVRSEIAQDQLDRCPASKNEILHTDRGSTLCFDAISGRYFKHDIEKIRRTVNDLNHDLMGIMWVPLNDLYYALGLPGIKIGDELGWTVDELIDIQFSSKLTDDGEPCLVMDYDLTPRHLKSNFWSGL